MKAYDEYYCDRCMCRDPCGLVEQAKTWIRQRPGISEKMLFETAAETYPGAFRPFMLAWADEFGGI